MAVQSFSKYMNATNILWFSEFQVCHYLEPSHTAQRMLNILTVSMQNNGDVILKKKGLKFYENSNAKCRRFSVCGTKNVYFMCRKNVEILKGSLENLKYKLRILKYLTAVTAR